MDALHSILDSPHVSLFAVALGLTIVGQLMSERVFTSARARVSALVSLCRETVPFQILATGIALDAWQQKAFAYYFGASAASLAAWCLLQWQAKKRRIHILFPGDTIPPNSLRPKDGK